MRISVQHNLDQFNRALIAYERFSSLTPEDVLHKQGAKLGYAFQRELKGISPRKGFIREDVLARLRSGGGIRISPTVRQQVMERVQARSEISSRKIVFGKRGVRSVSRKGGRRLNLWALMAQREIGLRESARAFLSASARFRPRRAVDARGPSKEVVSRRLQRAWSRYGPPLSEAGLNPQKDTFIFRWTPSVARLSGEAGAGLHSYWAQTALTRALHSTTDDIMEYVRRKMAANKRAVNFR